MSARVTAQPTMASGAVKIGKSFTGSRQAVGVSGFAGKPLKARAVSMGRRVAAHQPLRVVAEKVVGIDLGTTNSAVRPPRVARRARASGVPRTGISTHASFGARFFRVGGFRFAAARKRERAMSRACADPRTPTSSSGVTTGRVRRAVPRHAPRTTAPESPPAAN